MQEELLFTTDSDELWNGDIAEHIVAQELLGATTMFGEKRMFWVRDARNSQAEVDFVIRYKSHLLPIEVKTGNNSKLRSLHQFMEESRENIALRLWNGPLTSDVITRTDGRAFILYNIPPRAIVDIQPQTMARLAELPRIIGVKDATGDLSRPWAERQLIKKPFAWLSGEDATAVAYNIGGGQGCATVVERD